VLLQSEITPARPRQLVIAEDAFEMADPAVADALESTVETIASLIGNFTTERLVPTKFTDWLQQQLVLQSREAWETVQDWIDQVNPRLSFRVGSMYGVASKISDAEVDAAKSKRETIIARMNEVLTEGVVICLPTTPTPAPLLGERLSTRQVVQSRLFASVSIASTTGIPQINLPLAEVEGLPVGLSLMGARGSDEMLIAFAREVADALD
jgi:amidase